MTTKREREKQSKLKCERFKMMAKAVSKEEDTNEEISGINYVS